MRIGPLGEAHDRTHFDCGSEALNRYLRQQASQDVRRLVAACFVATLDDDSVCGYYTLASTGIPLNDLPVELSRQLPRYPLIPAVRMGRMAVDGRFKGQGLGGVLLADAIERSMRSEIAAFALVVDAKDDSAAAFYRHHGFIPFHGAPRTLFLPFATARKCMSLRRPDR